MWLLTIEDEEGTTTYHRLARQRCTVGRGPDNDVVLSQLDVSRRHARFEREAGEGGRGGEGAREGERGGEGAGESVRGGEGAREGDGGAWIVADEGSDNGTFINGSAIEGPTRLGVDDVLQIGGYRLSFSDGDHTDVPTPAPRYVPPARLRVLAGPAAGTEHVFGRDEIVTLGRSDDCTVRLLHENIIGVHAMVQPLSGGRYEVVDTSGYGIFVNGRGVARRVLEGGDAINIAGVVLLRFLESRQASDPRFDGLATTVAPPAEEHDTSEIEAVDQAREALRGPGGRFEAVGPKTLRPAGLEPASFRAARESSVRAGTGRDSDEGAVHPATVVTAARAAGTTTAVMAARAAGEGAGAAYQARAAGEGAGAAYQARAAGEGAGAAHQARAGVVEHGTGQDRPWWPLGEPEGGHDASSLLLQPSSMPKAAPAKSGVTTAPALGWWPALRRRREIFRLLALAFVAMALGLVCAAALMPPKSVEGLLLAPEGGKAADTKGHAVPARSAVVSTTVVNEADETIEPAGQATPTRQVAVDAPIEAPASPSLVGAGGRGPAYAPASVRGGSTSLKRKQHCWKQEGGPCAERP
ncbi:MAG: FHA domain-containing protein [Polyangiaceae bacterium]|jgi:pSer/pThr/pTyr-binding forkhead associated (FHA) protein|nr:FHA domain-containing protein [Polyangiaceae bacterium]